MRFVIEGPPRTKKNSLRIMRGRRGRPFVAQSAQAERWEESAILQLRIQLGSNVYIGAVDHGRGSVEIGSYPIAVPVNLRALVYRARAGRADLLNYLAAVSDALERAGVVADDQLVAGVDGSRLLVDRQRPRVEIELEPMP